MKLSLSASDVALANAFPLRPHQAPVGTDPREVFERLEWRRLKLLGRGLERSQSTGNHDQRGFGGDVLRSRLVDGRFFAGGLVDGIPALFAAERHDPADVIARRRADVDRDRAELAGAAVLVGRIGRALAAAQ